MDKKRKENQSAVRKSFTNAQNGVPPQSDLLYLDIQSMHECHTATKNNIFFFGLYELQTNPA